MAEEQVKVYPILPASTTGDLWHLASAAILNKRYDSNGNPRGLHIIPVIFMYEEVLLSPEQLAALNLGEQKDREATIKEIDKQRTAGPMTFNFLKDLGLDVLLVIVKGSERRNASIQAMLYSQDDVFFDKLFATQQSSKDYKSMDLQQTIDQAKKFSDQQLYGMIPFEAFPNVFTPIPGKRSLHYHAATTAIMMTLVNVKTRVERLQYLQEGLNPSYPAISGRRLSKVDVDALADQKLTELHKQITTLREQAKANCKIIIYNNRGNDVNSQTSSTTEIFVAFRKLVEAAPYNMRIVVINTGGPDLGYQPVLDLFNKATGALFPGLDPIVTCRFWNKLSKLPEFGVFGMFSGRSGSCDVAAFNGLNCFYWDTPFLELAAYNRDVFQSFGVDKDLAQAFELRDVSKAVDIANLDAQFQKDIVGKTGQEKGVLSKALADKKKEINARKVLPPPGWTDRTGLKADAGGQLAQSYRTLQQFLIMGVGYPENVVHSGDIGSAPWKDMRPNPLVGWLEGASFLKTPLFPRCPEILIKAAPLPLKTDPIDLYQAQRAWVYWNWDAKKSETVPDVLPDTRGAQYEAEGQGWAIHADALRLAGFRVGPQMSEDKIKQNLF